MNKDMKMKAKQEAKEQKLKLEDVKFYRLMVEFILSVFLIYGVIQAGNHVTFVSQKIAPVVAMVSGILFALSAVAVVLVKARGVDETFRVITSFGVFGNFAVLFFTSAHFVLFRKPDTLLMSLIIIALLYFVYSIYNRNFFVYSLFTGAGFIALSHAALTGASVSRLANLAILGFTVLSFVIPVAAVAYVISRIAKKKATGKVALSYIVSALALIVGAVLVIVSPVAVVYAEFALLAVYLVIAVSYTVKLM